MGYRIQEVTGAAAENPDLARFLADFVCSGELENPKPGDDDSLVWLQRFAWWWDENPYCGPESPRGYQLLDDEGVIVGFNGMIPFEYMVDGEIVPSLVTTTFFVREEHRSAVMGLLTKQRSLARTHHMIDGSPSPEMRRLLGRLGYEKSGERFQYFFPLAPLGGGLSRTLLRSIGLCFQLPAAQDDSRCYLATTPDEIESIPEMSDGKLRRHLTVESLRWLSKVGTEDRSFFGLCNEHGELISYAIGIYKKRCGVTACLLMDYVDLRPDDDGLGRLIRRLTEKEGRAALRPDTKLISWSVLGDNRKPSASGLRRDSLLYYQLPKTSREVEKLCVPFEGDLPLL